MFGGGHLWELAIVVILALIVFGPKRLPEIGGAMGKSIKEFKKGTQDLQDSFHSSPDPAETRPSMPRPVETPRVAPEDESVPVSRAAVDREAG